MSEIATMDKINRLFDYLKIESYIIPAYHLPLPDEANGSNFRPERLFRLYRNGTMSYKGYGYGATMRDIETFGIIPDQRYLTRAYLHLVTDARQRIKHRVAFGGMPNLEHLIIKFNHLDFLAGENAVG